MESIYKTTNEATNVICFKQLMYYVQDDSIEMNKLTNEIGHLIRKCLADYGEKKTVSCENNSENNECFDEIVERLSNKMNEKIQTMENAVVKQMAAFIKVMYSYKPVFSYNPKDNTTYSIDMKNDLNPGEELVFEFTMYSHFNSRNITKNDYNVIMLGSNTLNTLCGMIVCDEPFQEIVNEVVDPNKEVGNRIKDVFKSSMFYIGNTFYVDLSSDSSNVDYSEVVKKWGKRRKINFGDTFSMNDKTCLDLTARMGYPYVFLHCGNCEHIIEIDNVRLISEYDCLKKSCYPFYTKIFRSAARSCLICKSDVSTWIVLDNEKLPTNCCHLCDDCFQSFHYVNGEKVGNFRAVRTIPVPLPFSTEEIDYDSGEND